jgi:hypothetical protein
MAVAFPGQGTILFFCEWHYLTTSKLWIFLLTLVRFYVDACPLPGQVCVKVEALVYEIELFGCLFLLVGFVAADLHVGYLNGSFGCTRFKGE